MIKSVNKECDYLCEYDSDDKSFFLKKSDIYLQDNGERIRFVKVDHFDDLYKTFVAERENGEAMLVTEEGCFDRWDFHKKDIYERVRFDEKDEIVTCKFVEIGPCGDDKDNSRPVRLNMGDNSWAYCWFSPDEGFKMYYHVFKLKDNIKLGQRLGCLNNNVFNCFEYVDEYSPYIKLARYNDINRCDKYYDRYRFAKVEWKGDYILGTLKGNVGEVVVSGESIEDPFIFDEFKTRCDRFFWGLKSNEWIIWKTNPKARYLVPHDEGDSLEYNEDKEVFVRKDNNNQIISIYDTRTSFIEIPIKGGDVDKCVDDWRNAVEEMRQLSRSIYQNEIEIVKEIRSKEQRVQESLPPISSIEWENWEIYYYRDCGEKLFKNESLPRTFYVQSSPIPNPTAVLARKGDKLYVGQQLKHLKFQKLENIVVCKLLFELKDVPDSVFDFLEKCGKRGFKVKDIIEKLKTGAEKKQTKNEEKKQSSNPVAETVKASPNVEESQTELNNQGKRLLSIIDAIKNNGKTSKVTRKFTYDNKDYSMKSFQCTGDFNPFEERRREYIRKDSGVFVLLDDGFSCINDITDGNNIYEIPGEGKGIQAFGNNANGAIKDGKSVYLFYKNSDGQLCFLDEACCFAYRQEKVAGNNKLKFYLKSRQ